MKIHTWQVLSILLVLSLGAAGQNPTPQLRESSAVTVIAPYRPITGTERLRWVVKGTIGPRSLATGLFTAGIATAENHPEEYGPGWEGFGKRYGIRLTGVATSHAMEAGIGALWGEDPRYFRSTDTGFGERAKHVALMTFAARRADGHLAPAYARFIAFPSSNFISNSWRADSVATTGDALSRTGWAFVGRMASNAFAEFWPDMKKHLFHKKKASPASDGVLETFRPDDALVQPGQH